MTIYSREQETIVEEHGKELIDCLYFFTASFLKNLCGAVFVFSKYQLLIGTPLLLRFLCSYSYA